MRRTTSVSIAGIGNKRYGMQSTATTSAGSFMKGALMRTRNAPNANGRIASADYS
jgi:hypothetical protein